MEGVSVVFQPLRPVLRLVSVFCLAVIIVISTVWGHQTYQNFPPVLHDKSHCDQVLKHRYLELCYQSEHRLSLWASHILTERQIRGRQSRTDNYRKDPLVIENPVEASDYRRSGFDRGHLVPAADMKQNYVAMSESFFMTNMTPQRPGFNRGIWQSLERLTRKLVLSQGTAQVVTAPVLKAGLPKLKKAISIPEKFYKIIFWPDKKLMLAFLIPNQSQSGLKPSDFQVTVDEIEQVTGLDFFSYLSDSLEEELEGSISPIPSF